MLAGLAKKTFGFKFTGIAVGVAFLVGTIGGGVAVRKIMDGTIARKEAKRLEAVVADRDEKLRLAGVNFGIERRLKDDAISERKRLEAKLEKREQALTDAYNQTSLVMARIPKDTHTIEVKGNEIGNKLANQKETAWVSNIWPSELHSHAFYGGKRTSADTTGTGMPLAGGYSVGSITGVD